LHGKTIGLILFFKETKMCKLKPVLLTQKNENSMFIKTDLKGPSCWIISVPFWALVVLA